MILRCVVLATLALFCRCSSEQKQIELPTIDAQKLSPFDLLHIETLNTPPSHSLPAWNVEVLKSAGIHRIELMLRGGKDPSDTLELIEIKYNSDYTKIHYRQLTNGEVRKPLASGTISYTPGKGGEILFPRYFSVDNPYEARIIEKSNDLMFVKRPLGENRDTTRIMHISRDVQALVSKQNQRIYSLELIVPETTSTTGIIKYFNRAGFDSSGLQHARCVVTFTRDGKPVNSFLLNPEFSQIAEVKSWLYTEKGAISHYSELENGVEVRSFQFHYSENLAFPTTAELDSKHYTISYY